MREVEGKTLSYNYDLDGLRALAVCGVIIYHLNPSVLPGGFLGVDVFFVLSGFLISGIIIKQIEEGSFSILNFYSRRCRRILPALLAMLVVVLILSAGLLNSSEFPEFINSFSYSVWQVGNFYFASGIDYFSELAETTPLLHTWSLGVEEQFYLFWPWLLLAIYKSGRYTRNAPFLIISLIVCFSAILFFQKMTSGVLSASLEAFFLPHCRAWQFAAGCMCFLIGRRIHVAATIRKDILLYGGGGGILLCFVLANPDRPAFTLFATIATSAFLLAGQDDGRTQRKVSIFSKPLPVWLGRISYSLYLWHWPVICFLNIAGIDAGVRFYFLSIVLFTLFSVVSYYLIEEPFRRRGGNSGRSQKMARISIVGKSIAMIFVIFITGHVAGEMNDAPWRITLNGGNHVSRSEIPEQELYEVTLNEGDTALDVIFTSETEVDVLLIGDSHARHYYPAVKMWAESRGLSLMGAFQSGVPALFGEYELYDVRGDGSLRVRNHQLMNYLELNITNNKSLQVVMLAMRADNLTCETADVNDSYQKRVLSDPVDGLTQLRAFDKLVDNTIRKIRDSGKNVVVLGQVPILNRDPNNLEKGEITIFDRIVERYRDSGGLQVSESSEYRLSGERNVYRAMEGIDGVTFYDPSVAVSSPFGEGYSLLYRDFHHLNLRGAEQLGRQMVDSFSIYR